jgi:hypothetical protein
MIWELIFRLASELDKLGVDSVEIAWRLNRRAVMALIESGHLPADTALPDEEWIVLDFGEDGEQWVTTEERALFHMRAVIGHPGYPKWLTRFSMPVDRLREIDSHDDREAVIKITTRTIVSGWKMAAQQAVTIVEQPDPPPPSKRTDET